MKAYLTILEDEYRHINITMWIVFFLRSLFDYDVTDDTIGMSTYKIDVILRTFVCFQIALSPNGANFLTDGGLLRQLIYIMGLVFFSHVFFRSSIT